MIISLVPSNDRIFSVVSTTMFNFQCVIFLTRVSARFVIDNVEEFL